MADKMRTQMTGADMKVRHAAMRWAVAAAVLASAPTAFAQTMYRCTNGASSYLSDRPCSAPSRGTLGAYGPAPERPAYGQNYTPTLDRAPDFLPYLSPECAQLNDAIRTGPARGLKSTAMSELHLDYRQRCVEDEQQARQRLSQVKNEQRDGRRQAQAQVSGEKARATLTSEQCYETLRILAARRKRTDSMSPGERSDLDRFEANYKARCSSG
jgi:hypothetical protein